MIDIAGLGIILDAGARQNFLYLKWSYNTR